MGRDDAQDVAAPFTEGPCSQFDRGASRASHEKFSAPFTRTKIR